MTFVTVMVIMLMAPIAAVSPTASADETVPPAIPVVTAQQVQDSVIKGLDWYASTQNFDGSWSGSVGVTGFVVICFAGAGYDYTNTTVQNALKHLRNFYNPDVGILADTFENYETAISLIALSAAGDPEDVDKLPKMAAHLERLQFSDGSLYNKTEPWYNGGWTNYAGIPDASNSQFGILGLMTADLLVEGYSVPDNVWTNATEFMNICQNWPDVNNLSWAHNITLPSHGDGGFVYNGYRSRTPLGEQMFESYGSMTAAGLYSYLAMGNDERQPEVAAARAWLDHEYNMEINPKMVGKGLYYYLWSQTRALALSGQDWVVDGAGKLHDWRADVANLFMDLQMSNGKWPGNPQIGWREEEPEIAGIYAILTMQAAYLMVPNPELEISVENAGTAMFWDLDGNILATDPALGLTVTDTSLTCTNPEVFRKIWVQVSLDNFQPPGGPSRIVVTGTWGDDRSAQTMRALADGGSRSLVATGGFAGPFGLHATVLDDPPMYDLDKKKVVLTRGETEIIDFELTEISGKSPITRAMLITHAGDGIVADVEVQGIDVPAGDVDVLRVTISVAENVKANKDWHLLITSSTAPPTVVDIKIVQPEDDGVTIGLWYWLIIIILVVLAIFFLLLPKWA
jgi:squalene-hopene/tetraprenyl-beta-curcumene cyclase